MVRMAITNAAAAVDIDIHLLLPFLLLLSVALIIRV